MTQEDFKARVSMVYEGREQWEAFLDRVWLIHISELPRWISVADELPPRDGVYLVCTTDGSVLLAYHYTGLELSDAITHWMPMPEPPKEGGEE